MLRKYLVYNTVVRLCHFCCCGMRVNFVRIPYSHDRFSKISKTFLVKKLIPIKPTYVEFVLGQFEQKLTQKSLSLSD